MFKNMKKNQGLLALLCSVVFLGSVFQAGAVSYGEESGYTDSAGTQEDWAETDTEAETEDPIPESYYWPIESNDISGWPQGPQIEAEAAAVMDADTGAFLYSKNTTAKEYPASITKIMTCMVALEHGNLDDVITFSEIVYDIEYASSHCGIKPGEKLTLRQALYALMMESANDAANGIAEFIGGSVSNFVDMMNQKAAELGCTNTHFMNPHGLHDDNHYTCARDMALIAQAAFENKTFRKIVGTVEYSIPPTNETDETRYFLNHQKMMYNEEVYYEPCIGGKTGFTEQAYNTLVTYAKKDKRTLISVILHVNGSTKSFLESAQILNYGYDNFKRAKVRLPEYSETVGELAGANYLSELAVTYDASLSADTVKKKSSVVLDIPAGLKTSDITKTISPGGVIRFSYQGWDLGSTSMRVNSLSGIEVSQPQISQATLATVQNSLASKETEKGGADVLGSVQAGAKNAMSFLSEKLQTFEAWVMENDLAAAVLAFMLILVLIPVLIVAWSRNSKAKRIRKARKQEREERVRMEEDIDTKSVSEIEQELRQELEKELESRKKKEEQEALARKEEAEMAEAEKIIEEREAVKEAEEAAVSPDGEKED